MSNKIKPLRDYRYYFTLYITNKNMDVICKRFFDSKTGLKDDIQEASELSMDLIYSDIVYKSLKNKPIKTINPSILSLCVYDNDVEIACVEQPLSNVKNKVKDINIKEHVKDIFKLLRK
jgi:hypothetical protein